MQLEKKLVGLDQLSKGNYKKALRVFETINSYFDLGSFTPEEKENIKLLQISSLLNTSLILQQMEKWKEIILVVDKALTLSPDNVKLVWRKALALKNLQEFEESIKLLTDFSLKLQSDENLKNSIKDDNLQKDLDNLLNSTKQALNEYTKKQKTIYSAMFK